MKNTFGSNVTVTLYGESHGTSVGAIIDGLPAGISVDAEFIEKQLGLRRPDGELSTSRIEADTFTIESGVFEGKTTGTPILIRIMNSNTRSSDYSATRSLARPSHADYTAHLKYNGFEDYRGGGHFSGRVTTGLVATGAIAIAALNRKGIYIGTHIAEIGGIKDIDFSNYKDEITALNEKKFAVLDDSAAEKMKNRILDVKAEGDSIGGILETAVYGMPSGVGEPWFDTVEGVLSHAIFSIPAIKGVEFGLGFGFSNKKASEVNDAFCLKDGKIMTETNNNGGINGGITNGMPIVFRSAVKPTPTIFKEQKTVDFIKGESGILKAKGRHDPCIVPRARVVVDSVTAIALCDLLTQRYGTDWLAE